MQFHVLLVGQRDARVAGTLLPESMRPGVAGFDSARGFRNCGRLLTDPVAIDFSLIRPPSGFTAPAWQPDASILDTVEKPKVAVSKTAIRKAIDGGGQVPGADLIVGKKTLVRK